MRAAPICIACSHLFKQINLRIALENNIRIISYGWTRGQSKLLKIELSKSLMLKNSVYVDSFIKNINKNNPLRELLPSFKLIEGSTDLPILIHPLNAIRYDEKKIIKILEENVGWIYRRLGSNNSTNCKLNSLATYLHQKKYGFHPYAMEIAGIVRSGGMNQEEGKKKIKKLKISKEIKECAREISLNDSLLR